MIEAPESGYDSQVKVSGHSCFYFKTASGQHGKMWINKDGSYGYGEGVEYREPHYLGFVYVLQSDGSRRLKVPYSDLASDRISGVIFPSTGPVRHASALELFKR
jgi:hypothetical protein